MRLLVTACLLLSSATFAADKPDVADLKRQLQAAEAKVRELKVKLAAADNPKTLPNGRVLAFHTDDRGRPTKARAGEFDSYVDVRACESIVDLRGAISRAGKTTA